MNLPTIIVLAVIAALAGLCIMTLLRTGARRGSCGGACSDCGVVCDRRPTPTPPARRREDVSVRPSEAGEEPLAD